MPIRGHSKRRSLCAQKLAQIMFYFFSWMTEVVAHQGNKHPSGGLSAIAEELGAVHTEASHAHSQHGGLIKDSPTHGSVQQSPSHATPSYSPSHHPPTHHSPPHSAHLSPPPSPPPLSHSPRGAISAYCIPFATEKSTDCLLKVRYAESASTLLFRLLSSAGERDCIDLARKGDCREERT